MKRLLAMGLSLVLAACGSDEPKKQNIDYQLQPHVDWFLDICLTHGNDFNKAQCRRFGAMIPEMVIVKTLDDTKGNVMARCHRQNRRIEFHQGWWSSLDDTGRKQLVAHEMSHCLLSKGHKGTGIMAVFYVPQKLEYLTQLVEDEVGVTF